MMMMAGDDLIGGNAETGILWLGARSNGQGFPVSRAKPTCGTLRQTLRQGSADLPG